MERFRLRKPSLRDFLPHPGLPRAARKRVDSARRAKLETLERRMLLAADLSGDQPFAKTETELVSSFAGSALTAFTPEGVTQADVASQLTHHAIGSENGLDVHYGHTSANASVTALVTQGELEPNNTVQDSNQVPLGFDALEDFAVDISGTITSGPISAQEIDSGGWNLQTNGDIESSTTIPHVSVSATGDGSFDYYSFTVAAAGDRGIFDLDQTNFDTYLFLYDDAGNLLRSSDDNGGDPGSNSFADSLIDFTFASAGTYVVGVGEFFSRNSNGEIVGNAPDPGDVYTLHVSLENHVLNASGIDPISEVEPNDTRDLDFYEVELEPGDIFGANVGGGATGLTFYAPDGTELIGSSQDITFAHPLVSPLPGGGNAALSYVIDTAGSYTIAVDEGLGDYTLNLRAFRPELESQRREDQQILFLDFDGENINAVNLFGGGNPDATLSPLSSFLDGWGLSGSDEDAVIDSIIATVEENYADVGQLGNNGDFDTDGVDGNYGITILNSRDHTDPFGRQNVSRVVVGGSISELGIGTIGIAESIDVGNFETEETAVVLLDLLSTPASNPNSLNQFSIGAGFGIIDLIGVGVGNIVAHEAGHFFANWHNNQFNAVPNIMDQGGDLPGLLGLGPDLTFGTADDIDVDFGKDQYVPNEGFTGTEDTLNSIAFGLSTGTVDTGQRVVSSSPDEGAVRVGTAPTSFVLHLLDPVDLGTLDASDLSVNAAPADSVTVDPSGEIVTFSFDSSPAVQGNSNTLAVAENAFTRVVDGDGVEAFSASFTYDAIVIEPVTIDPADGLIVEQPLTSLTVEFNEPYGESSIGTDDLVLSAGAVSGFVFVNATTVEYLVDVPAFEGDFTVSMPDGAVADAFGNVGLGFVADYELDFGQVPYPIPLTAKAPLGSLIYDPSASGTLGGTLAEFDGFESGSLDGQWSTFSSFLPFVNRLQVADDLVSGTLPSVAFTDTINQADLFDPFDGWPGNWSFDNPIPGTGGNDFAVVTTGTLLVSQEGTYSFALSGDDGGRLRIDGADVIVDDNLHAFLDVIGEVELTAGEHTFEWVGFDRTRGSSYELSVAVGGGIVGPIDASNGWQVVGDPAAFPEISLVGPMTTTAYYPTGLEDPAGRIRVTGESGTAAGDFALLMDKNPSGNPSILNEAIWTVDLSGQSEAVLSFSHASFGDERNAFPVPFQPFVGQYRADGIAISNDGVSWYPAFRSPLQPAGEWFEYSVDLAAAAEAGGLALDDGDFFIKFQQFDNLAIPSDGLGWDEIAIEVPRGDVDSFTIDVDPGQTISVVVDGDESLQPNVELFVVRKGFPLPGSGGQENDFLSFLSQDRLKLIGADTADAKGGNALIQTVDTKGHFESLFRGPQTYLVRVSGASDTIGSYETQIVLNAMVEEESVGRGSNGSLATAENLEDSVIGLNTRPFGFAVGNPVAGKPGRAAALGSLESPTATVPEVFEDVEPFFGNRFPFIINPNFQSMRYQQVYAADEFDAGGLIDELRFRRSLNSGVIPEVTLDVQINIGYAATTVTTASPVFAENIGEEFQTVFDGLWTLSSVAPSPGADAPPPFDFVFDIAETFTYDPSRGDLLVEFLVRDSASFVTEFFSAAPGGRHEGTTRIYSGGDTEALDGIVGQTPVEYRPFGLVTQFAFVEEDLYQLDLKKGESATFTANALSAGNVRLEVIDEDGNVVAQGLPAEELIVNGSFETGDFSGWTTATTGSFFRPWAVSGSGVGGGLGLDSTDPQDGDSVAWNGFDGGGPMEFTMFQDVVIPADIPAANLSWQDRLQWNFQFGQEATLPRLYDVEIRDPGTGEVLETVYSFSTGTQAENPTGNTGWVSHSADLSAYIGQTVRLFFVESIPQAGTGPGQIEFDAISIDTGISSPTNVDDVINQFVAPKEGTYYVRVTGDEGTDYSLVATRSAEFDLEGNDDLASAQPIASSTHGGRQYVLGHIGSSVSDATTITFNELPRQPADGVSLEGVTFDYTINGNPSPAAAFGGGGPGTTTHTDDPAIEGPSVGVLGLTFGQPVSELQFGIAMSTTDIVPDAASVRLFDQDSIEIGVFNVAAEPGDFFFSSGLFVYQGSALVSRAEVTYNSLAASRLVFDNLTFAAPPQSQSDFYRIEAKGNRRLVIATSIPAGRSGEFVNQFDPLIRLYDASGNLVASDDNGAFFDPVNARLSYRVPRNAGGTYYVEVTASDATPEPTSGEYILSIQGNQLRPSDLPLAPSALAVSAVDLSSQTSTTVDELENDLSSSVKLVSNTAEVEVGFAAPIHVDWLLDDADGKDDSEELLTLLAEDQATLA